MELEKFGWMPLPAVGDVHIDLDNNMDDAPAVVKAVVGIDTGTVVAMITALATSLRSALHIFQCAAAE